MMNGTKILSACMSMPRLGFTDNFAAAFNVFNQLGIPLRVQRGVFWEQSASQLLINRIDAKDDYLVFVDYDSLFNREQFEDLFRLFEENDLDAIFPVQVQRGGNRLLVTPLPNQDIDMSQSISPVLTGHFGLTILRLSSIARIPQPFFWSTPNNEGLWEEGVGRMDADNGFWIMANQIGLKVCQANHVRIGHMELRVAWPMPGGKMGWTNASDFARDGVPLECMGVEDVGLEQVGGDPVRWTGTDPPDIKAVA